MSNQRAEFEFHIDLCANTWEMYKTTSSPHSYELKIIIISKIFLQSKKYFIDLNNLEKIDKS